MSQLAKHAADRLLEDAAHGIIKPAARPILRAMLTSEDTFATVLFLLVMDVYGPEALEWHPETIRMQLEQDFGLQLPKENLDKIMSAITIVTTNFFFKDVSRFIELCNILSGDDFEPETFDPASVEEILWGVIEAMLLYPPEEHEPEDTEFCPEIRGYIEEVLKIEGVIHPPDVLRLGGDRAGEVLADFADEPEMAEAFWQSSKDRNTEMLAMVRDNLRAMAMQLKLLPLEQGSTEEFLRQIEQVVGVLPDDTSTPSLE